MLSIVIPCEMENSELLSKSIRTLTNFPNEKYEVVIVQKAEENIQ
jgi:hypothetical protein